MTTPTPTEERLRSLLIELADSTPVRDESIVLPVEPTAARVVPTEAVEPVERREGVEPDELTIARRRRSGRSRVPWIATAVAGVVLAVALVGVLRARDAADPFARSQADVPWVDLSALDGGRLAFVMGNDLFLADAQEGMVRRITDVGRGNEVSYVSWSHDGEWVAFSVHDQNGIWVVRRDGSERHRLPGRSSTYTWSPTNDELAYVEQEEVRVGQVDGSWRALEGNLPPVGFTSVAWSPDGDRLAFTGSAGNLEIGTLQGRVGEGWGSRVSPQVGSVLAWPRDDYMVVREPGLDGALVAFDPTTSRWSKVVTLDHGFSATDNLGIDASGQRMLVVTDAEVWACPLDQGIDTGCSALGIAGKGLSSPRIGPAPDQASFIATDQTGAAQVVTTTLAPGTAGRSLVPVGQVDASFRGTVMRPDGGFGVEPEPQIPVGAGFLVRVDEGAITYLPTSSAADDRVVVAGSRFDRPSDNYPGGSGLAYWHP